MKLQEALYPAIPSECILQRAKSAQGFLREDLEFRLKTFVSNDSRKEGSRHRRMRDISAVSGIDMGGINGVPKDTEVKEV